MYIPLNGLKTVEQTATLPQIKSSSVDKDDNIFLAMNQL